MASSKSIIKKVTSILNKIGPPARLVYLRKVTRTGGDPLTGYTGTTTTTDTLLAPQPYYVRLGRDRVPGGHTKAVDATTKTGNVGVLDDWTVYVSPEALSFAQISDPNFMLVFKQPATTKGGVTLPAEDEVMKLIDNAVGMIYGDYVIYTLYMRSNQRS